MPASRRPRTPDRGSASSYPRSLRVNQVLRQIVAEELERLADADERLRLLTVTSVDTSPDLRTAKVYVASLDDEAAEALDERRSQLQRYVGSQVRMKRTPRLTFVADPAVSAGARVDEVLRRIHDATPMAPELDEPGADGSPADDES
jgi:ribosome-binding factor A